jgi:hypothetical protein
MRLIWSLVLLLPGVVWGHAGKVDANGCHADGRGGSHCHATAAAKDGRGSKASANALHRAGGAAAKGGGASKAGARRAPKYANCREVRAAGAAPIRRGDPGYGPHLDPDKDGIGCN